MRSIFVSALFTALVLAEPAINPVTYQATVRKLSAEDMKGRGTGSPELEKAAKFLAAQYKSFGLAPAGAKTYFQWFDVTTNAKLGQENSFFWQSKGTRTELKREADFLPFNFSGNGKVDGSLVFAGYGITAPEYDYDDYAGIDVKDKIVVILRHEPQEFDEKSIFTGKVYTRHAQMESKAVNAKFHGAKAVLFVSDLPSHSSDTDTLDKFSRNVGPGFRGIPFVQVRFEVAEKWVQASGKSLKETMAAIDRDRKPQSFALDPSLRAEFSIDVRREVKRVPNVAAYLPGESDEYIILGAHYDHLGLGEQFSMSPADAGKVHPGADDNASGTAGTVEVARYFSHQPKPKRGILFLNFAGEELGLLGSSHYVNNPLLPLNKAVAMINMDMIGRVKDGKIFVSGTGTGSTLKALVEDLRPAYKLNLDLSEQGGYGSSDHTSFNTKQIPILFFFSGLHGDYHRPSDTWDKINNDDAAVVLDFVVAAARKLIDAPDRPQYVRMADPRPQAVAGSSSSSGYGPYFGSIPDMSEVPGGFRISDVREGSPAAQAGLKGGDILFEFDGKPIANLYDFTYALRARKPGDVVLVKARRGTEVIETKATLSTRK